MIHDRRLSPAIGLACGLLTLAACGDNLAPPADLDAAVRVDAAPVDAPLDADPSLASLTRGQLASWSLDGDGRDRSGHGLDLQISGVPFATGRFGQGLDFAGTAGRARRPVDDAALDLATGDFTVSVWVRPTATEPAFVLVKGGSDGWFIGTPGNQWAGYFEGEGNVSVGGGGVNVGVFTHLALVRDGGQYTLLVDGVRLTMVATRDDPTPTTFPLELGRFQVGNDSPLPGVIDDLAIWDRALTAAELTYLRSHPAPPAAP